MSPKKVLFLLIFCTIKIISFCQTDTNYIFQFHCERSAYYDSTVSENVNVVINGEPADSNTSQEAKNLFLRSYINSIKTYYDLYSKSIGKDSAYLYCKNFSSNNKYSRYTYSSETYLYAKQHLYKKRGSVYNDLIVEQLYPSNAYLIDSVVYTSENININNYKCIIAISKSNPKKKYFICTTLPKNIVPGILVINAIGAILGVESPEFSAKLISLSKNRLKDISLEM